MVRRLVHRRLAPRDPALRVQAFGVHFSGPFGLAAGFDKDAGCVEAVSALGFGHVEVGTITAHAQPGNARPRMFRLVRNRAIINRMGFNNAGASAAARSLARPRGVPAIVGVNIGKTKVVPESGAVADYVASARELAPLADYLVVNVSSPNTPGLRDLQAVELLGPLLRAVKEVADATPKRTPLLVKIAPDLADADVDAVADLALDLGLDGIIATNTTIGRQALAEAEPAGRDHGHESGGLSGRPLKARSLEVLRRLRARVGDRLVLVSVGGVEDVDDVWGAPARRGHARPGLQRVDLRGAPLGVPREPRPLPPPPPSRRGRPPPDHRPYREPEHRDLTRSRYGSARPGLVRPRPGRAETRREAARHGPARSDPAADRPET
ncbi:hypothetical protein GCM10018952_49320 [Streptosporangium vulgare]